MKKFNMPLDVKAVFKAATDVEEARSVPLCVSVLLDETAPADLVAFVRSSFASASPQARVSVNYFEDNRAVFDPRSDMAVIAAGVTEDVADVVLRLQQAGIPAMVVTTLPNLVATTAEERGCVIPAEDLIAPEVKDGSVVMLPEPVVVSSEDPDQDAYVYDPLDPFTLEPYALTEEFQKELSNKMGEWIVSTFKEKRLAFAQAFDFVRRPLSLDAVKSTSIQNGGVGLVVIIPGADMPVMTMNQAKMILQIAAAYGQPLTSERVKELAAVVGGGFALRSVARQVVGVVPALGWAVKAAIGYTGTLAMGHAAIEYFEGGGNVAGLAAVVDKARAAAVEAADSTVAGRTVKGMAVKMGEQAKEAAARKAKSAVKSAPGTLAQVARVTAQTAAAAAREASKPQSGGNSAQ